MFCFSSNFKLNGKSIDQIDFILHKEDLSKHESIEKAKQLAGIIEPKPKEEKNLETTFETLRKNLIKSNKAQNYLKGRKLSDIAEIGYNYRIIPELRDCIIFPLNHYIQNIYKSYKNNLFIDKERTLINQLQYITKRLKNQLKENEMNLKSLNQLRQSRYAIWYKQHGIRKAQYLGGFKSTYTIQKYANLDIEDLKSAIKKFHPLG